MAQLELEADQYPESSLGDIDQELLDFLDDPLPLDANPERSLSGDLG